MPTNTHTFFYRTVINDKVNTDISTTRGYLSQIKNNTNNKTQATVKVNELKNNVDVLLGELEAEIKNEVNPGFGPKSKEILRKFATLLGVDKVEPLSYKGTSKQDRDKLCDAYRTKIYILAENRATNIMAHILSPNSDNIKEVKRDDENLALVKNILGIKLSTSMMQKTLKMFVTNSIQHITLLKEQRLCKLFIQDRRGKLYRRQSCNKSKTHDKRIRCMGGLHGW